MSTNKSQIIKKLSDNYPNFLRKDLKKLVEIFVSEVKSSLKRHERVELRDVFSLEPRLKKARMNVYKSQITSDCFCCFNLKKN